MKYFITEAERKKRHSTFFFEFQKGAYPDRYWCEDSLCLHGDIFDEGKLFVLFSKALPYFHSDGRTVVRPEDWKVILSLSRLEGGETQAIISELAPWVEDCFQGEKAFTICGI